MVVPRQLEVVVADAGAVDVVSGLLWAAGTTGIEERPGPDGSVVLVAGVDAAAGPQPLVGALGGRWPVEVRTVDDDAYLDAWRAYARPGWAGERFVVVPAWLEGDAGGGAAGADAADAADERDLVIVLDPGRAFGSGAHPSTQLALAGLEVLVAPGDAVLDVGCGSGVLSVGAALLGAGRVVAVDVDPEAVRATADNAERNAVAERIEVSSTPLTEVVAAGPGSFDVVVANISAAVLRDLAPALTVAVGGAGSLVLSGFLAEQAGAVRAAYDGWRVAWAASADGWSGCGLVRV